MKDKLTLYKAKSDGESIYEHNHNLLNIWTQLKNIHDLDNSYDISNIIKHHDIGKVVDDWALNPENTHRKLRHEILSASAKDLTTEERLYILLHHKYIKDLIKYIDNQYYP